MTTQMTSFARQQRCVNLMLFLVVILIYPVSVLGLVLMWGGWVVVFFTSIFASMYKSQATETEKHEYRQLIRNRIIDLVSRLNQPGQYNPQNILFSKFLADICPFWGQLVPLLWISGDISSMFQSQCGFCLIYFFCGIECNVHSLRSTSGATPNSTSLVNSHEVFKTFPNDWLFSVQTLLSESHLTKNYM